MPAISLVIGLPFALDVRPLCLLNHAEMNRRFRVSLFTSSKVQSARDIQPGNFRDPLHGVRVHTTVGVLHTFTRIHPERHMSSSGNVM